MLTNRAVHSSQGTRQGRCSEEVIPGPAKKQEGKEIWKVNSGGERRPGGCSSLRLIYPARITMQFERTNGRCEDLAGKLSFHCRIFLHFAPSCLGGFIRLGQGASAPQTEGMSVGGEREERSREPRRNACNYFPRSFTISKKYPDLGENISRVPGVEVGGWRAGTRWGH